MKIVMFTNTYRPHVGGVANSLTTLEEMLREQGHHVWVVAPQFPDAEESTDTVLRVPAFQNFNGSDFSVCVTTPDEIDDFVDEIGPDVIHSHHPYLLGDAALRAARRHEVPIVFTHHTMYEHYTHYVPLDSQALKRLAIQLATEYCNLCDAVIAPSESVEKLLRARGVKTAMKAIPTGIDLDKFGSGRRRRFRQRHGLDGKTFVVGHVGRLAEEKNLGFLSRALGEALAADKSLTALIVGDGAYGDEMKNMLRESAGQKRVIFTGKLTGQDLVDAYSAMDLFVIASQSETQGMVVAEAMATGNPVVALDGPGIREVVASGRNGELLEADATESQFAEAVLALRKSKADLKKFKEGAAASARHFDRHRCARAVSRLYEVLIKEHGGAHGLDLTQWERLLASAEVEWNLFVQKMHALRATVVETEATEAKLG